MNDNYKLLEKQISEYLPNLSSKELKKLNPFFKIVDKTYLSHKKSIDEKEKIYEDILDSIIAFDENLNYYPNKNSIKKNLKLYDLSHYLKNLIIQRTKNQKELTNKEKYLRTIVNSIKEWICVIDTSWKVKLFNNMASEITWVKYEDIINQNYKNHIYIIKWKSWKIQKNFIQDISISDENIFIPDNINIKSIYKNTPISILISPLKDDENNKKSWHVIVFRDIRKKIELDNIKKEFLSIASHELRTPMTVINGYVSILIQKKIWNINEKQNQYLNRIQKNIKYLISMVNDMLDIAKHESWKMKFNFENFDLYNIIKEELVWLAEIYKNKNISTKIIGKNIEIISDKEKVKQALINIISNAYKFTEKWWKIDIYIKKDTEERIKICVKDNWVWIKKEDIDKLFKKFSQVTNYLQKKEDWTWLGLAISKTIIEKLWGTIWIESDFWKWSNFYFYLPIEKNKNI